MIWTQSRPDAKPKFPAGSRALLYARPRRHPVNFPLRTPPDRLRFALFRFCPYRLARPRTPPFHGENRGSNPRGDAKKQATFGCGRA